MSKTIHHVTGLRTKDETDNFLCNLNNLVSSAPAASVANTAQDKSNLGQKASSEGIHSNVPWNDADQIITCGPNFDSISGTTECSRRDSGISISSPYPCEGGTAKEGAFRRHVSQRGSFSKVPQLQRVQEGVVLTCGQVPRKPVKPVKWVRVPARLATREYSFSTSKHFTLVGVWELQAMTLAVKCVSCSGEVSLWCQMKCCPTNVTLDWDLLEEEFADTVGIQDADDEVCIELALLGYSSLRHSTSPSDWHV